MAYDDAPLSDEERAELEALRAAKREAEEADRERRARAELERLRKDAKYLKEDAEYYAEKERKKEERRKAWENPDYSLDDLEPMPLKQKIILGVIGAMIVVLGIYLVMFNGAA